MRRAEDPSKVAALPLSVSLLRTKRYGVFWVASLLSNIGTWMQQVAQPWVILSMTQSSFLVGLDSFALNSPGWIFTLLGGSLADRRDRKKIILICQSIQFVCILIMLALLIAHRLQIWMIISFSFLIGTTDSLSMPSFQSIIPSLVSKKEIPRAITLNATQYNVSRILGPAIAGVIMASFGAVACFGANAFSYLPFFIALFWIYPKPKVILPKGGSISNVLTASDSYRSLLKSHSIRSPLATIFVTSLLCGPLTTFCPVLIKDVFHADVGRFGGAIAALGLGGLFGAGSSFFLFKMKLSRSRLATGVAILLGVTLILISLNRSLVLLNVLMVAAGVCMTLSSISAGSYLQETASNLSRGKMVSLSQLAMQLGISAGGLLTGLLATHFGVATAFLINGSGAIVLQSFILTLNRKDQATSQLHI